MAEKEIRLIDANALEKALEETKINIAVDKLKMFALIENAPTISPESLRPHGKWRLNDDGSGTCLNCCRTAAACWDYDNALSYCPHCGAKMDEDEYCEESGLDDLDFDRCYECGAYGDDYRMDENGDLVSNCDDCPYSRKE